MDFSLCFEDKLIRFTDRATPSEGVAVWEPDGGVSIAKVLQIVENSKELQVISPDPEALFRNFCAQFSFVEAGGGLVTDEEGNVLLIHRNGRWDLPKGHREPGEGIDTCAAREVEEETGIRGVACGPVIADTLHFYQWHGVWTLKRCRWYAMGYGGGDAVTMPQVEEGITAVEWVAPSRLEEKIAESFRSIREVFAAAGYLDPGKV